MPSIRFDEGLSLHCTVDDYLWPWEAPTPVLMMHGFARNANFWNRWVPAIADSRRVYRPDLLGCGKSDVPAPGYAYTPEKIGAQILAVLDAHSLSRVHWVGESSGGILGLLLAAAYPGRVASLVLCNTPARIPDAIRGIYALGQEGTAAAIRTHGTGEWCRQTLGYRLDLEHASAKLQEWVIAEMDKTRRDVAAALHECFEVCRRQASSRGDQSSGAAAERRQEPDRLGPAEDFCRDPATRPARVVRRVRARHQPAPAGALRAGGPRILANG